MGFGLETDLRRADRNHLYIAHDPEPWTPANDLNNFVSLFLQHMRSCIAINVKELGDITDLISLQLSGQLGSDSFYFDFELLEPNQPGHTQCMIREHPRGNEVRLAAQTTPLNVEILIAADPPFVSFRDSLNIESQGQFVHPTGTR